MAPSKQFRIQDLVPPEWLREAGIGSVWLSCFRMWRVPDDVLRAGPECIDVLGACAAFIRGSLTYIRSTPIKIVKPDLWNVAVDASERRTEDGTYLLLLAPYATEKQPGDEAATRRLIVEAVGLLVAWAGRNVVYERVFDNVFELATNQTTSFGPALLNPLVSPEVDLSPIRLAAVTEAATKIGQLHPAAKDRILLSLRWFKAGLEDEGTDAFLKLWIALETLGMPNTTDIRPLSEVLARAYEVTKEEASRRFVVGKLFGLRSKIVHAGALVPMHFRLIEYVGAVYVDVLFEILGMPSEKRAEGCLADPEIDVRSHLDTLLAARAERSSG